MSIFEILGVNMQHCHEADTEGIRPEIFALVKNPTILNIFLKITPSLNYNKIIIFLIFPSLLKAAF